MKKLLLTASAVALFGAFATSANAECDGIYGALRLGAVKHDAPKLQSKLEDQRFMMSGALGYRYEYFRAELEYVWRKYNRDVDRELNEKALLKTYSYMFNVYYDILPYNWWSPFVGAGVGLTKTRYTDRDARYINANWSKSKFTWSLGGGLSLKVTNRFNVDAGYRYYDFGKPGDNGIKYKVKAQEIYAGIRYVF